MERLCSKLSTIPSYVYQVNKSANFSGSYFSNLLNKRFEPVISDSFSFHHSTEKSCLLSKEKALISIYRGPSLPTGPAIAHSLISKAYTCILSFPTNGNLQRFLWTFVLWVICWCPTLTTSLNSNSINLKLSPEMRCNTPGAFCSMVSRERNYHLSPSQGASFFFFHKTASPKL